jgi:uncharacterized repeat protein (TIGR02543 family)
MVEGKSATFTVTVTDKPAEAKEILNTAVETAANSIKEIAVSADGSGVPEGVLWVTPAQKKKLDDAIAEAQKLAETDTTKVDAILKALEKVEKAAEDLNAAAKTQTGKATDWSYTVVFNINGGEGENPESKTVATPNKTLGDNIPANPSRSGYMFSGWNTNANGSGITLAGTTPITADSTVYAQWTLLVNARAPVISVQPRSAAYLLGVDAVELSVTATSPDSGELGYQWLMAEGDGEGMAISGATGPNYTPPTTTEGVFAYYVRITNTNNSASGTKTAAADSNKATVTVTQPVNTQAPAISVQPQSAAYLLGASAAELSVTAEVSDGGTLSYQWHSAPTGGSWTAIEGATTAGYTPSTAADGTIAYYVRITNTNNNASGTKTAATNSNTVTVRVTTNAALPVISGQPQDKTYAKDETATALSVTAISPDGGTLSYQWHSAPTGGSWTAIEGATTASYMPPTAEYGSVSYYARITNTNSNASGVKTASVNSNPVVVTVARVNARQPVVSVQPQSVAFLPGAAATALTVTASSPDGGTLSYQWHSRGSAPTDAWEPISSETTTSYTPPTATPGTYYYYVAITNTNTAVDGVTTAITNSSVATVKVTTTGSGGLVFEVWAKDDERLISDMPEYLDISRSLGESFTIAAADDLTDLQWSFNNTKIPGARGTDQSITIESANYAIGTYTLGLYAKKDGVPYSINITFVVDN